MNTLLTPDEIIQLAKDSYPVPGIESCTFIGRGFNDHYLIATKKQKFIFRVYLNNKYYVESADAYRFELDLLRHLLAKGIPVSSPIAGESGELMGWTDTEFGKRAFALFTHADGIGLRRDSIFPDQGFQLGIAMAEMHLAANSFKSEHKRYKLDLKYLIDEPLRLIAEHAKSEVGAETSRDELIRQAQQVVEKLQPLDDYVESINKIELANDEFGIIHADLHLGNIHFRGTNPMMFDFDHCAYGWRAYDLAIAYGLPVDVRDSMIRGYESRRPLSDSERSCLRDFANLRNLWNVGDILATESLREMPERQ